MIVEEWLGEDNQLGKDIWTRKYALPGEDFEPWLDRVSGHDEAVKELIRKKKFLFGGRTLSNRGTGKGSLANCYSYGYVGDSLDEILDANTKIAKTYKAQGGQGLSLSKIRPKGAPIKGGIFQSDGIIPFMEIFNTTTASISQGGSRKGALLMSCDIWHKDIEDFITIKAKEGKIEKANLSVEIDDDFMNDVINGVTSRIIKRTYGGEEFEYEVNPVKLFDLVCEYAKNHAEPGILFVNRLRNYNIMEKCDNYEIETTNPCGEQPLKKHGCCNLLSINLISYVKNPYTDSALFDFEEFKRDIPIILRASDRIVDENIPFHALQEQKDAAKNFRNCGMGIMGLADTMVALGLRYDSNEAINLAGTIMKEYFRTAVYSSVDLAKEKGSFPEYRKEVWDSEIMKNAFTPAELEELKKENKLRNCSLISVAPTGLRWIGINLKIAGTFSSKSAANKKDWFNDYRKEM